MGRLTRSDLVKKLEKIRRNLCFGAISEHEAGYAATDLVLCNSNLHYSDALEVGSKVVEMKETVEMILPQVL